MKKAIGIDLGTYNSSAAFATEREVIIVESRYGKTVYGKNFPSFVLFDHNGKMQMVGKTAKAQGLRDPKLLVWGVKRLVGLSFDQARSQGEFRRFKYDVEKGPGGSILIRVGEERYTPSHILELILREIKQDAENTKVNPMIGSGVERAVISVPAYFDATRVAPILNAGKNAGFTEVETIAEPTAAAMSYDVEIKKKARILTFDLGAGTLDVTVMLLLNEGGRLVRSELGVSGDSALGGLDMDDTLVEYLSEKYRLQHVKDDPNLFGMLREEAEKSKIRLSSRPIVPVDLPIGKTVELTRVELENVVKPILERCRGPMRVALQQAGVQAKALDYVLFVGGPTYMPCVRATVKDELGRLGATTELLHQLDILEDKFLRLLDGVEEKGLPNPMEAVARGASLKAAQVDKPAVTLEAYGYGLILGPNYYSIIPPNSTYPITLTGGVKQEEPGALRVQIRLAKKLPYNEADRTLYKYFHLGGYDCYIRSTGEYPVVDVIMQLTKDKDLITTFTHRQTLESVRFERLSALKGKEVTLRELREEDFRPPRRSPDDQGLVSGQPARAPYRRDWTQGQFDRAVSLGRTLVDNFAEHSQDIKVEEKKKELLDLIENASDPRRETHPIMARIEELLVALTSAGMMSENDLEKHLEALREIERTA